IGSATAKFLEVWRGNQTVAIQDRMTLSLKALTDNLRSSAPPTPINSIETEITTIATRLVQGYTKKYGESDEFTTFEPEVEDIVALPGGHKLRFRTDCAGSRAATVSGGRRAGPDATRSAPCCRQSLQGARRRMESQQCPMESATGK